MRTLDQLPPEVRDFDYAAIETRLAAKLLADIQAARDCWPPQHDKMEELIREAQLAGIYPKETVEGNPNDVVQMVKGWGAQWFVWKGPFECQHCGADLRDQRTGPPFKREIGRIENDRCVEFTCPDCGKKL